MEHKKINSCDSVCDRIPPLSPKYPRFVAQNLEDEEDGIGGHIFYTIDKPDYHYQCQIPELVGRQIRACFHGWVILCNHRHDLVWSLWNPLTFNLISLPPLQRISTYECCLSSHTDDPSAVFLLTTPEKPAIILCPLNCQDNKLRWTEVSYEEQLRNILDRDSFLRCPTSYNGKVYALHDGRDSDNHVIHVDVVIKKEEVVINLVPIVEVPNPSFTTCPSFDGHHYNTTVGFLKGSSTELLYVIIDFGDESKKIVNDVYLFKLNMDTSAWEEMHDIKDAIIFIELARDYTIWYTSGVASHLGGYIHILEDTGKVIYSYCIKDRTISLSSMSSVVGTSKVSSWAMLECRLKGDYGETKCIADTKQQEEDNDTIMVMSDAFDEAGSNSTTDESHLLDIPFSILESIMEFCVGVEYLNFRATCKLCHLAAPSIQWNNESALKRMQNYSLVSPWLMVLDKHQITFTDPMYGEKYFIKTPQELSGDLKILCSRYGWLLMFKLGGSLVFFNPFTRDIRELPETPCLENCCFSAPPTSPDCMVIGFISSSAWEVYIHHVSRETHGSVFLLNFDQYNGGDLYALCNQGELYVSKDLGVEDYSWNSIVAKTPRSRSESSMAARYFQVKCDGHVLLVVVSKFGEFVYVFKQNDSTKELEKVSDLGKHAIFICDATCLCIETEASDMKNKIYFPRFHLDDRYIVFYSLQTCTYNILSGENMKGSLTNFLRTTHYRGPHVWIEPSWS